MNVLFKKAHLVYIVLLATVFCSCVGSRNLKYFDDMPQLKDGTEFSMTTFEETRIQPDDIINVKVNTIDNEASEVINSGNSMMIGNNVGLNMMNINNQMVTGYLVDKDGNIEIPVLGTINVGGHTLIEAKELVRERTAEFYKNATVSVRYSNFRITLIGEVSRPGTYIIPNEQVSILDAIGFSGDLTVYGRRNNVMLIRKNQDGKAVAVKIDLSKKELFQSPYYYLHQNDIVYIEPSKARILNTDTFWTRFISVGATIASLGIVIYTSTN